MRIVAISDVHGHLPAKLPPGDLLVLAGDLCPLGSHAPEHQAEWLDRPFRSWLEAQPHGRIIGIAGNHDFIFERKPAWVPPNLPWTYLQDSGTEVQGWKVWGSPWQPWFFNWAFNARERQLKERWRQIPGDTDILVLHGPPHGYGDAVPWLLGARHVGCKHLLHRIEQIRPRLALFGHIHEGRGEWQLGPTTLANVTLLNEKYEAVHPPWVFELQRT